MNSLVSVDVEGMPVGGFGGPGGESRPGPRLDGDETALMWDAKTGLTDLGRMAQLVNSNERLFGELRRVRGRLEQALDYWREPAANRGLAGARLRQLRDQHASILDELRSNRAEALELLARYGDFLPC